MTQTQTMPIMNENPPSRHGWVAHSSSTSSMRLPPSGYNPTPAERKKRFIADVRRSYGNDFYRLLSIEHHGTLVGEAAGIAEWAVFHRRSKASGAMYRRYASEITLHPIDLAKKLFEVGLYMPITDQTRHHRSRTDQKKAAAYQLAVLVNKTVMALSQ